MDITRNQMVILAIAVIIILLLLLRPIPSAEQGQAKEVCVSKQVPFLPESDNWNALDICGSGCLIESMQYDIAQGYIVTCECCDCQLVGGTSGIPECEAPLGYIYGLLAWCEWPVDD